MWRKYRGDCTGVVVTLRVEKKCGQRMDYRWALVCGKIV